MSWWAPILTTCVALTIATLVYWWQKTIDRRITINNEMRREYANFWALASESNSFAQTGKLSYESDQAKKMIASLSYIDIYGDSEIHAICRKIFDQNMRLSELSSNTWSDTKVASSSSAESISVLRELMKLNDQLKLGLKRIHSNQMALFPRYNKIRFVLDAKKPGKP